MKRVLSALALVVVSACSGGGTPVTPTPPPATGPQIPQGAGPLAASMFERLPSYIATTVVDLQGLLPSNPNAATQIGAKLALLQRTTLVADMVNGRMFIEGAARSSNGRTIAIAALFPDEVYRGCR